MYLNRVTKEHEGTPWAMLAKRELDDPLGWKWVDSYTDTAPKKAPPQGNGNAAAPQNDQKKMLPKGPEKRPLPKL